MRPTFCLLATSLILALAGPADARITPIPNEGASLVVPDDWKTEQHDGFSLVVVSPDEKSTVTVRVIPNHHEAKVDESFYLQAVKEVREKMAKQNHSSLIIVEAGTAAINGVPASYIHTEEPLPSGQTIYSRDFLVAANGKFYGLTGDTADPFLDSRINDIIGTFHFDRPPVLPDIERPFYRRFAQVALAVFSIMMVGSSLFWWLINRKQTRDKSDRKMQVREEMKRKLH